ncbi:MAG: HEAT repeat domain-containing protein [Candidatus Thorarchaeota archaeon]
MAGINIQSELTKLKSPNIGDRKNAAWILGDTGDRRIVDPLINALKIEPDRFVRMNIIKALAKINDRKALSILNVLKDKDPDSKVKKEAAWAYFKIKEEPSKKAETKATRTVMKIQKKPSSITHKTPSLSQPTKVVPKKPIQMRERSRPIQKSSKPQLKSQKSSSTKTIARLPSTSNTLNKAPSSLKSSSTKPSSSKPSIFAKKSSQSTIIKKQSSTSIKSSSSARPITSTTKQVPKITATKTVTKMPPQPVKKQSTDSQKDKSKQQFLKPKPVIKKKK